MTQRRHALRCIMGATRAATLAAALIAVPLHTALAASPHASVALNGAGSTFVGPLLLGGWVPAYTMRHPGVSINYGLTGSGQGISLWTAGSTDFAASDALLKPSQETAAKARCGGGVTKVPVTIGAVALIYNLPGVKNGLKLTPDLVARIFLGQIKAWSDTRIARLNSGVTLPHRPIYVVHRSDGSGTTYIMTHYLAAVSSAWKTTVGSGATVAWPTGLGAKGSSGVAAQVARTAGAISYVDLAYAIKSTLTYALVQNAAGAYVAPGVASAAAAAAAFASNMPSDLQQVIVNAPASAAAAYPITGYSYIFLCSTQKGEKGRTLVDFVRYAVTQGQAAAAPRYYAPLPRSVQNKDVTALNAVTIK